MRSIGEKVAKLRAERGWTLKQLSDLSGVSLSHISAIENQTRPNPSIQQVMKLAKAFGVSLAIFDDSPLPELAHALSTDDDRLNQPAHFDRLQELYDAGTQQFILSETARPYVDLAMKLAGQETFGDASSLLQTIAAFMAEQKHTYRANREGGDN